MNATQSRDHDRDSGPATSDLPSSPGTSVLLRHEFLRTRGAVGVVVAGATLFGLVGALMAWTRLPFIEQLGSGLGMFAAGALVPVLMLVLTIDYWRSSYGRLGYFTHTVPVRGSRQYLARLLHGWLLCVAAAVWSLVLGALAAIAPARAAAAPGQGAVDLLVTNVAEVTSRVSWGWWLLLVGIAVALIAAYLTQYYFAVSLGSEARLASLGPAGPVLVWFVVYVLMQVLAALGLFAVPFGLGMAGGSFGLVSMDLWGAMFSGSPDPEGLPLGFVVPIVVASAFMAWRTAHSWNHKVSLR